VVTFKLQYVAYKISFLRFQRSVVEFIGVVLHSGFQLPLVHPFNDPDYTPH
jgi:hypothetical protein